jgi:hypothetical protein
VGGLRIPAVPVRLQRHALLADEHSLAQLQRGVELLLRSCGPDLQDQRA